eukprot:5780345-Amphidinium_carterae.1
MKVSRFLGGCIWLGLDMIEAVGRVFGCRRWRCQGCSKVAGGPRGLRYDVRDAGQARWSSWRV